MSYASFPLEEKKRERTETLSQFREDKGTICDFLKYEYLIGSSRKVAKVRAVETQHTRDQTVNHSSVNSLDILKRL